MCGTPVTRPPSKAARSKADVPFCSPECHYKARGLGLVGREVTEPYAIPEETRAAMADRIRVSNERRKSEGRYGHTEETKLKLSRATALAIAEGRVPRVSKLEQEVGVVLGQLGVKALPQHIFRRERGRFGAVVDFYLPGTNTALEVNGTFWHADPREYPNGPVHASQRRTAKRYARKMGFLADLGVPVVEVWELDFRADPEGAVREALGL